MNWYRLLTPDVIFAESVGSCADLVATVIKPMLQLHSSSLKPTSFSVYVDSRLLRLRLLGNLLPFTDDVIYIFEKQIEEAGLVVINKIDLLSEVKLKEVEDLFNQVYPQKTYLLQDSLAAHGGHCLGEHHFKRQSYSARSNPGTQLPALRCR